ncbi:WD40 repeat domain-containing protein, partial [Actinocorallia lasiicapitis]
LTGHAGAVTELAFIPVDGVPVLVSAGGDRTIRLWDLAAGVQLGRPLAAGAAIQSLAVTELDGAPVLLVGGADDRQVGLWSLRDRVRLPLSLAGHRDAIKAVAAGWLQHGPAAITCGAESVMVWDLLSPGRPVAKLRHGDAVLGAATARIGARSLLLTSGADGRVMLWDLLSGTRIGPALEEGPRHTPPVAVALGLVDGTLTAVTSGRSPSLKIWSLGRPWLLSAETR